VWAFTGLPSFFRFLETGMGKYLHGFRRDARETSSASA
jgi:hypothetical protein